MIYVPAVESRPGETEQALIDSHRCRAANDLINVDMYSVPIYRPKNHDPVYVVNRTLTESDDL